MEPSYSTPFPSRFAASPSSASALPREPINLPALRHDGFTPERQARFLHHLAQAGTVRSACLAAGVSPQAAYVRRRRCARFAAACIARKRRAAAMVFSWLPGISVMASCSCACSE